MEVQNSLPAEELKSSQSTKSGTNAPQGDTGAVSAVLDVDGQSAGLSQEPDNPVFEKPARKKLGRPPGVKNKTPKKKAVRKKKQQKPPPNRGEALPGIAEEASHRLQAFFGTEGEFPLLPGDRIVLQVTMTMQGCAVGVVSTKVIKSLIPEVVNIHDRIWEKVFEIPWSKAEARIFKALKNVDNNPQPIGPLKFAYEDLTRMNSVLKALNVGARLRTRKRFEPEVDDDGWLSKLVYLALVD